MNKSDIVKMEKTNKKLENYPIDCERCEVRKKLKGYWVSGAGMTISLYQCPECVLRDLLAQIQVVENNPKEQQKEEVKK